jgi:antitoxin CptB
MKRAMNETREARVKRLLWRSEHRGIREMDILMGGFARLRLAVMSDADLNEFEGIIDIPDQQLLAWATGAETIPPDRNHGVLAELISFRP